MRKIKEILRLKWECKLSNRKIAKSCSVAHSTVADYLLRAKMAGLSWPLEPEMDDAAIENLLFPVPQNPVPADRKMPDMGYLYREMKKKSVTLQLLWYEYKQANPDGYQYSQFCNLYRQWVKKLNVTLRQEHRAGEKLFIDYAGQTIPIVNRKTGEIGEAQIFVATLGASNYTFAEASISYLRGSSPMSMLFSFSVVVPIFWFRIILNRV
jgi:transposase